MGFPVPISLTKIPPALPSPASFDQIISICAEMTAKPLYIPPLTYKIKSSLLGSSVLCFEHRKEVTLDTANNLGINTLDFLFSKTCWVVNGHTWCDSKNCPICVCFRLFIPGYLRSKNSVFIYCSVFTNPLK